MVIPPTDTNLGHILCTSVNHLDTLLDDVLGLKASPSGLVAQLEINGTLRTPGCVRVNDAMHIEFSLSYSL